MSAIKKRSLTNGSVALIGFVIAITAYIAGGQGANAGGLFAGLAAVVVGGLLFVILGDLFGRVRKDLHTRWVCVLGAVFGSRAVGIRTSVQSASYHRRRR
jgi:uncharacterized membrane-anchored protein